MHKPKITSLGNRLSAKIWIAILAIAVVVAPVATPAAMGGQAVWAADSCTAPATDYGTDTMSVTIPSTASYTIWIHMKVPSTSASSILLNVAGTCYNTGGGSTVSVNAWKWVNAYDGNASNVMTQSLAQGGKGVVLTGTSTGVRVDEIEFVPGSCVPTGDGSNCTTASTTTGGGTTTGSGGTTTSGGGSSTGRSGGGSGSVNVVSGGSLTPSTTSTPTQVDSPVTLQPATADPSDGNVLETQYYLNNKLLATVTTAPFTYKLDTTKILNGTYTLTTKTTYDSGKVVSTSQKIIIKNPFSLMQAFLAAEHYIIPEIIILIILIVGFRILRKRMQSRQSVVGGAMPMAATNVGGDTYSPLSYTPSSYPTEIPSSLPPAPGQSIDNTPSSSGENSNPLPYSNTPSFPATGVVQPQQVPPGVVPPNDNNGQ